MAFGGEKGLQADQRWRVAAASVRSLATHNIYICVYVYIYMCVS